MAIPRVPLDISEGFVSRFAEKDTAKAEPSTEGVIGSLTRAATAQRGAAERLRLLAESIREDASFRSEQARSTFGVDAAKAEKAALGSMDEAMKTAFRELSALNKVVAPPRVADQVLASEIRQALAKMPDEDRVAQLTSAGDDVISAVASAPAFVIGSTPELVEKYVQGWKLRKFPDEMARVERLGKALEAARRINGSFENYVSSVVTEIRNPRVLATEKKIKRLKEAREAIAAE